MKHQVWSFKIVSRSLCSVGSFVWCCLSVITGNVSTEMGKIQWAFNAFNNGNEIVCGPGTYVKTITFIGKAITLRSSATIQQIQSSMRIVLGVF